MTHITLNAIRAHRPCQPVWEKLLEYLGKTKADDEPLAMTAILDACGVDDANWCLRALGPEYHKMIVGLACNYVEMAMEYAPAGETRPAECIRVTRLWIEGKATLEEVEAARLAALAALAARDAALVASAAALAGDAAGWAGDAAEAAWRAARTARWAAAEAAGAEMREKQAARFREVMESAQ